jgi:hypothetical protein
MPRSRMAPRAGRVSPPMDVRSPAHIPEALRRMKKGPITIVLVYADWCGHCQRFKPMFQEATNTSKRDTEVVSVNDEMLETFNNELTKALPSATPLAPSGYPEVMIVNNKGKNIGNVPPSASKEDIISVVSNGSAMVKTPATATNAANAAANATNNVVLSPKAKNALNATNTGMESANITPMSGPVLPPVATADIEVEDETLPANVQKGGGLFGALSSAAYTLAPAGLLLAGLHSLRMRKTRKAARRHRRK